MEINPKFFLSQSKEDRVLMKWFKGKCGGRYIEMGGLDGLTFSNTYAFHYGLNWTGIMIEASPGNFAKLKVNRPDEIATVHAGVCDKEQDLHWVTGKHKAVDGFLEFAAPSFQQQWWTKEGVQNAQLIKCKRLDTILEETVGSPYHFDIFSLDVEGAELGVLRSIDFSRHTFGIVLVEADEHNHMKNMGVRMILESNGYRFLKEEERSYWFANERWDEIYEDVLMNTNSQ